MSRRWIWMCGFVLAAAAATSASMQTYVSMQTHGHVFGRLLSVELVCWGFWAAVAPLLAAQGSHFADPGRARAPEWRRAVALGVGLIVAHVVANAAAVVTIQPFQPVDTYGFQAALAMEARSMWMFDMLACTTPLLIGYGADAYARAQRLALRESRLEADLARAQLDALRLEIEPHFLFNTLNSIASLIRTESPDRALSMLLGLSDLMRSTLDTPGPTTTLAAELAFVQRYIALQRVRFMDRLTIEYAIEPECETCEVPTFLLQPLVENAFRHGVARRSGPCSIVVSARVDAGQLHIRIRDDGAGLPAGFSVATNAGVGFRNTQSRLERGYGGAASLSVASRAGGGTDVDITLPATSVPAATMQAAG